MRVRKLNWDLAVLALTFMFIFFLTRLEGGHFYFGGEGNFFIDFNLHAHRYGHSWFDVGYGMPNFMGNAVSVNHLILRFLDPFVETDHLIFCLIYSLFVLPFFLFFVFLRSINVSTFVAFASGIFYAFGPFGINYLQALNQWNVSSLFVIPLIGLITRWFYGSPLLLLLAVGSITRLFSFAFYNPPTAVVVLGIIPMLIWVCAFGDRSREEVYSLGKIVTISLFAYVGFLTFNVDWLYLLASSLHGDLVANYVSDAFLQSWLEGVVGDMSASPLRVLELTSIVNPNSDIGQFYSSRLYEILLLCLSTWLVVSARGRVEKVLATVLVICFALSFGIFGISKPVFQFLLQWVPFFSIFKTPTEKFGILLNLAASVLLAMRLSRLNAGRNFIAVILITLTVVPIMSVGSIVSGYAHGHYQITRDFKFKSEELRVIEFFRERAADLDCRILSFPGSGNYQVLLDRGAGRYYSGLDPILNNVAHPYVYPTLGPQVYQEIFLKTWKKTLRDSNVCFVINRHDDIPWFGSEFSARHADELLTAQLGEPLEFGPLKIYQISSKPARFHLY